MTARSRIARTRPLLGPQVVCFGEVLWDLFEQDRRGGGRREAIARSFRRELGGAPANVATGLARLGVRSALVGGVGTDAFGEALVSHLRADRVDVRGVLRLPRRTGLTFVFRDARGEPSFLFYRQESADLAIGADDVTRALGELGFGKGAKRPWLVLGTSTGMTESLARATTRVLDAAERAGARVLVDLNVRAHLWRDARTMKRAIGALAARADLVKASASDLSALGARDDARFLGRYAPGASWLVTRAGGEASALGEHAEVRAPALRVRVVDATGAGDAFLAGALATLIAAGAEPGASAWGDPAVWGSALRVGHLMGRKAVSRVGAVAGLERLSQASALLAHVRKRAS